MRMKRMVTTVAALGTAVATTGIFAAPALAAPGGSVQRYQEITIEATLTTTYVTSHHEYTGTLNPATGQFWGTGSIEVGTKWLPIESITGTYENGKLSFYASYPTPNPDVAYGVNDATVTNGTFSTTGYRVYWPDKNTRTWPVTGTVSVTSFPNHGAFVSANPGATAAESLIGMPLQSR